MTAQPYNQDRYTEALATLEKYATETAIAAAPILGLLPSAVITAIHCEMYLHFGPVFSPLTGAGVESVSIAIVATRVLLQGKGLAHREKDMDRAFLGYIFALATINLGLNIFNLPILSPASWGQMLAELALGCLGIPVAWLVATRHEIVVLETKKQVDEAKDAGIRAQNSADIAAAQERENKHKLDVLNLQSEENAKLLKMKLDAEAAERDKKRAEKASKSAQAEKQVAQVNPTPAKVASSRKRGHIDLAVLASKLQQDPTLTNDQLGAFFQVSGEAVRLARKKL